MKEIIISIINLPLEIYDRINCYYKKKKLVYEKNAYWDTEGNAFCSNCIDNNNKLIRLHTDHNFDNKYYCPGCKTSIMTKPYTLDPNIQRYNEEIRNYIKW